MATKRIMARRNVTEGVAAWVEPVVIPTYPPQPADHNPMFLERRVYQGSSGKVYPLPFTDRVGNEVEDRTYQAVHLENEYLYLMILPEIGGRIHIAIDKTNDYDFFYRQNVIKPALVGLAGPWISGGVEINWPQHHRPSTFMPCEFDIEEHADGSKTVWLSEHEPMNRMKGMHGVCLRPGNACIELKGHVYNRTPFVQSFLWWANVGVHVNDDYQSFFPPDVHYVADHARRAISEFPECKGFYYGVDYRPGTRLDWYKNIPVPTSYMVLRTEFDFFGGYDHGKRAGFVHIADRFIAPGKKQWTWGNHRFGWAWDRNLTDADGPYVELMAGVYTDNQPDFSYLFPYECRSFRQVWYPIQGIGPADNASMDAAISLRIEGDEAQVGVSPSRWIAGSLVVESNGHRECRAIETKPGKPWLGTFRIPGAKDVSATLVDENQNPIVAAVWTAQIDVGEPPSPAVEPPGPEQIDSLEELYLTGLHLEQYRHATSRPEDYWHEALLRDPFDSRCNTAQAIWRLRRGEYREAEDHARRAIGRLTHLNMNPREGESHYVLGMALERQGRQEEAIAAYSKATWDYPWAGAAHYRLACLITGETRIDHLEKSLERLAGHKGARCLLATIGRKNRDFESAYEKSSEVLKEDRLDHWALREAALSGSRVCRNGLQAKYERAMGGDPQNYFDLAIDYDQAGFPEEALATLNEIPDSEYPMVHYARSYYGMKLGIQGDALSRAQTSPPDYCFPSRLEEIEFLIRHESDPKAAYYLGNLLYDRRRYAEAIASWERSVAVDPEFSIPWRNLGIAYFNVEKDAVRAKAAYDRAVRAKPSDARLVYERDQLLKRVGENPAERLSRLDPSMALLRDDLALEYCGLLNQVDESEKALEILRGRRFAPWEGGEGAALSAWVQTNLKLGKRAIREGNLDEALEYFRAAESSPENLGEARHLLANASDVWYWIGEALNRKGQTEEARKWWKQSAEFRGDFQEMSVRSFSEMTYCQVRALDRLGRKEESKALLKALLKYAKNLERAPAKIDYFATSLPTMLLFEDDLQERQTSTARFLRSQALFGLGQREPAAVLLQQVLAADPNHRLAREFAADLSSGTFSDTR